MSIHALPTSNRAPPVDPPGGGDGHNGDMEVRVTKLESAAQDTRERLVRIETRLESRLAGEA